MVELAKLKKKTFLLIPAKPSSIERQAANPPLTRVGENNPLGRKLSSTECHQDHTKRAKMFRIKV